MLPKEYITLDYNQHTPLLERAIFEYAELARSCGYKDVQMVFTPLMFMERCNFHLHPEQLPTKRYISPKDKLLLANRHNLHLPAFNESDYDYLHTLSQGFHNHMTPQLWEKLRPEDLERARNSAFILKRIGAISQDAPHDRRPETPGDIDLKDFDDLAITAGLYCVAGIRKHIHPYMKRAQFNSADYSIIAHFEDHLSAIVTSQEERMARTIFISRDRMLTHQLMATATAAGNQDKAELHTARSMGAYLAQEIAHIREHIAHHPSPDLPPTETLAASLDRLQALLEQPRLHHPEANHRPHPQHYR